MSIKCEIVGPAFSHCATCGCLLAGFRAGVESQCQDCRILQAQIRESVRLVEVSKLTLKPGDVLAVKCDRQLSMEQHRIIKDWLSEQLPPDIHTLVLDPMLSLQVVEQPACWVDRTELRNIATEGCTPSVSAEPLSEYDVPLFASPPAGATGSAA